MNQKTFSGSGSVSESVSIDDPNDDCDPDTDPDGKPQPTPIAEQTQAFRSDFDGALGAKVPGFAGRVKYGTPQAVCARAFVRYR